MQWKLKNYIKCIVHSLQKLRYISNMTMELFVNGRYICTSTYRLSSVQGEYLTTSMNSIAFDI